MSANPNLSRGCVVHAGVPLDAARSVAVLVHGRDQDEQLMLDVVARLSLDDVAYLLPVAAQRTLVPRPLLRSAGRQRAASRMGA